MNVTNKCIFTGKIPYEKVQLHINIADVCVDLKKEIAFWIFFINVIRVYGM